MYLCYRDVDQLDVAFIALSHYFWTGLWINCRPRRDVELSDKL